MGDARKRLLAFASKAVPAVFLGGLGLALAGKIADNGYQRFVQTPEQLAQQLREKAERRNVYLDLKSGEYVDANSLLVPSLAYSPSLVARLLCTHSDVRKECSLCVNVVSLGEISAGSRSNSTSTTHLSLARISGSSAPTRQALGFEGVLSIASIQDFCARCVCVCFALARCILCTSMFSCRCAVLRRAATLIAATVLGDFPSTAKPSKTSPSMV